MTSAIAITLAYNPNSIRAMSSEIHCIKNFRKPGNTSEQYVKLKGDHYKADYSHSIKMIPPKHQTFESRSLLPSIPSRPEAVIQEIREP